MKEQAFNMMARADKGAVVPAPILDGPLKTVAATVSSWSGIVTTGHWDLRDPKRLDGVDFYVGEKELGHIHLDGAIHLVTNARLGKILVSEGLAQPFPYNNGWTCENVGHIGVNATVNLFRRNYERLTAGPAQLST